MTLLGISMPLLMQTKSPTHMYLVASSMSIGLTSSSFIKTYGLLQTREQGVGAATLAVFETVGGLLSPVAFGVAQSLLMDEKWTFVSTGMMVTAAILLLISYSIYAQQGAESLPL